MNDADFDQLSGGLHALAIRLADRIPAKDLCLISEFVDVGEFGVALEWMADGLSDKRQSLTSAERSAALALAERMGTGPRIAHSLSFCPES